MIMSEPFRKSLNCLKMGMPPTIVHVFKLVAEAKGLITSPICCASSLVGDKIRIFTFLNFPVCCIPYNLLNNGRMNAAVLPVPVCASPITSLPSNIIGIDFS